MDKAKLIEVINQRIPEIEKIFQRISALNDQSKALSMDIQELFGIWGEKLRSESNVDHEFYKEKKSRKSAINEEIQQERRKIEGLGGTVKDIQKGLVDFVFGWNGEDVCLCWKSGEEKVKHWHPRRGGFATRRPIEELLQAKSL